MHSSEKNKQIRQTEKNVFGIDFHDFIVKQKKSNMYELASEYGLSLREVRKLKNELRRS